MRFSSNDRRRWLFAVLFVLVLVASVAGAYAEPITRLSGVPDLASLKKYYSDYVFSSECMIVHVCISKRYFFFAPRASPR